jgi:recombination protein RecR
MIPIRAVQRAVSLLSELPGVGPRTAQRYAQSLLEGPRDRIGALAETLRELASGVATCSSCGGWDEADPCRFCRDPKRDEKVLMVVARPRDLWVIEETAAYKGRYFVLGGVISPLDGIGPDQLAVAALARRLAGGVVGEVILALDPSLEGEATAAYLTPMVRKAGAKISRLARGIPLGGRLELFDRSTLSKAIEGRQTL